MINSKDIFVECNLKTSQRNKDNSFTTTIAGGVILEQGDTITITDVAVNSKGIGGGMIQIPTENSSSNIATNKIVLQVGKYITNGTRFCLPMPFDSYTIDVNVSGNTPATTNEANPNYGYASLVTGLATDDFVAQGNLYWEATGTQNLITKYDKFRGSHQYKEQQFKTDTAYNYKLNQKYHSVVAPNYKGVFSSPLPCEIDPTNTYELEMDECKIEIPFGYDDPSNIARTITDQLHSAELDGQNDFLPFIVPVGDTTFAGSVLNPSFTNPFLKIKAANGLYNIKTQNGLIPNSGGAYVGMCKNALYNNLYHTDPKRWIYGERMNHLMGVYGNQYPTEAVLTKQIKSPVIYATGCGLENQDILITNIFSQDLVLLPTLDYENTKNNNQNLNLRILKDFIKQNQRYNYQQELRVQQNYENDLTNWVIDFDLGRFNDQTATEKVDGTAPLVGLKPYWLMNRESSPTYPDPAPTTRGRVLATSPSFYSRFIEKIYDNKKLSAVNIADGYRFVEEFTNADGVKIIVKDFLQENDMMFVVLDNKKFAEGATFTGQYLIGFFHTGFLQDDTASHTNTTLVTDFDAYFLNFFGFDPTFMRNNIAMAINTSKTANAATDVMANLQSVNYIQCGSPNTAFLYDEVKSRFGFTDLHFPYSAVVDNNGVPTLKLLVDNTILVAPAAAVPTTNIIPFPKSYSGSHIYSTALFSYSGSTIIAMNGVVEGQKPNVFDNRILITNKNFKETLLGRLGFNYNDLFTLGSPTADYNPSTYGNFMEYPYQSPSPITTNPKFITTYASALGTTYKTGDLTNSYDLNVNNCHSTETNCQSVVINASNLPLKLENPYWLIQSNIIPSSNFINSKGKKQNILAVTNRAYTSDDFAYGMGAMNTYVVENSLCITEITTQIFNNDFSLPYLDDNCVVLYKLTKNYQVENRELQANITAMENKK